MSGFRSRGYGKLRSSGDGLKAETGGEQLAFAQTISPPVSTSLLGTPSFANPHPKSAVHSLPLRRKFLEMELFSARFKREVNE